MIGSVLHQSVIPWQLLWFTVLCPRQLRTLRWSILRGVVIQLKAFTLWSGFTWATAVRNCNSWICSFSLSLNYCLAFFFPKPELPWACLKIKFPVKQMLDLKMLISSNIQSQSCIKYRQFLQSVFFKKTSDKVPQQLEKLNVILKGLWMTEAYGIWDGVVNCDNKDLFF